MAVQIKWRHDSAANWTSTNPVLLQGEPGFETDTGKYKIGNGTNTWTTLAYGTISGAVDAIAGLFTATGSDPATPSAGNLSLYTKAVAGRMMFKQIGPSTQTTTMQPYLARNRIGYWAPPGNATTLPGVFGYTAPTTVGTATAANVSATNFFTRMRRLSFVSAASVGSLSSFRVGITQLQLGDGEGNGGFHKIIRFGCSDTSAVAGARQFCGISTSTTAPTNVEPSTLTNSIGIGHGAADSNMMLYYGGTTAQTPINLGSSFPINTLSVDAYELALFSPASAFATVYYEVNRLNTGDVVTGLLLGDGASVVLPSPYTLLSNAWNYRTNNATALAVSLDYMSDYFETDN